MLQDEIKTGQLAFFKFDIVAPLTPGAYVESFA